MSQMTEVEEVYRRKFSYSNADAGDMDIDCGGLSNKNTEWLANPFTWVVYVGFCALYWAALHMTSLFSLADSSTIVNLSHGLLTFVFFHWIKGSPDEFTQGEWNGLTFWEQIDAGLPWTPAKKFMMIVPAALCLPPLILSNYAAFYVAVNLPIFFLLEVPKLPSMHRVRIMSINATAGIDDHKKVM